MKNRYAEDVFKTFSRRLGKQEMFAAKTEEIILNNYSPQQVANNKC